MGLKHRNALIFAFVVFNLPFLFGIFTQVFHGPAFYVVGGDSMERENGPQMGIIDFKDGVMVRSFEDDENIVTYYEGKRLGYTTFGDYGDVISFRVKGTPYPVSHRAICFVRYNLTGSDVSVDIPELGLYGVSDVTFEGVGFRNDSFHVDFAGLYDGLLLEGDVGNEGFLTKGDNRNHVDQDGMQLVANHTILGKVEVVDNELIVRSSHEYVFVILVVVVMIISYFSEIMVKGENNDRERPIIFQKTSVLVLFIFIFYKDISIIFLTEGFGLADEIMYASYALLMASLPVVFGYAASKILKEHESRNRRLVPLIIIGAFLPYYFIIAFITHVFVYSLVAYSIAVSLFYLGPNRYFRDLDRVNEKEIAGWILPFSIETFMLFVIVNLSLPFYIILIIGMIFVNYSFVSFIKNP